MTWRRVLPIVFVAVALGGATIVAWRTDAWSTVADAPTATGAALVAALVGMIALALPWRLVLRALGAPVGPLTTVAWYCTGEIGKYVPGGVWAVVGRGERARRGGVAGPTAYASVANSLVLAYAAAAVVAATATAAGLGSTAGLPIAVGVPVLGALALRPRVIAPIVRFLERRLARDLPPVVLPWRRAVSITAAYIPAWLAIGAAMALVAAGSDGRISWVRALVAGVVAWIVGFVVVIAPGGLGAREAAFAALLPVPFGRGMALALAARLVFVVADLVLWVGATAWSRRAGSVLDDVGREAVTGAGPASRVEATT